VAAGRIGRFSEVFDLAGRAFTLKDDLFPHPVAPWESAIGQFFQSAEGALSFFTSAKRTLPATIRGFGGDEQVST